MSPDPDVQAVKGGPSEAAKLDTSLYGRIVAAEKAARAAHDQAHEVNAPFWTRVSLGRAQSILMHYVVKHARGI